MVLEVFDHMADPVCCEKKKNGLRIAIYVHCAQKRMVIFVTCDAEEIEKMVEN